MKWRYHSENFNGNLHDAVYYINQKHPEWDVVAMHMVSTGMSCVVVWREELRTAQLREGNIETKEGLLYLDGVVLGVRDADKAARDRGFQCAEQLVEHLEKKK